MKISEFWQYLIDTGIATEEELQLITGINGYSENTLNDVLYYRTGYENINQLTEE
jgi:hypothetical protein